MKAMRQKLATVILGSLLLGGALSAMWMVVHPWPALCQDPAEQKSLIRTEINLVNILFTVTDKQGRYINSLAKDDFEVYENGAKQTIELFGNYSTETAPPLRIALLLDTSGSERFRMGMIKQTAVDFIQTVMRPDQDRICLIQFDSNVRLVQNFTARPEILAAAVATLRVGTSTALYDALHWAATETLSGKDGRKVVVLLTDGEDTSSHIKRPEALKAVQQTNTVVYAIGISDPLFGDSNFGVLKYFAKETGGRFYKASARVEKLAEAFQEVNGELKHQYGLGYISTNPTKDGKFRKVEVRARGKGLRVRHRRGYYTPTS